VAFVLDDVRESFTSDVTRFLGEIEKGSRAIGAAAALAVPVERTWQPPLNGMVVGLHGIAGSSSLIGVTNLADTARRIEDIATFAGESMRMLWLHANRLKLIAGLCRDGSSDLRVILEHELAGRTSEAAARGRQLHKRIDLAVRDLDELGKPPAVAEALEPERSGGVVAAAQGGNLPPLPKLPPQLAAARPPSEPAPPRPEPLAPPAAPDPTIDDGWAEALPAAGTPPRASVAPAPLSPDDELAAVFQAEAREALTNLRGYLARLEHNLGDRQAATQCARLLHLLKGAAASVGLDAVSTRAGELHAEVERMKAGAITAAAVAVFRDHIAEFIAITVPDLATPETRGAAVGRTATADSESADAEAIQIFREEARTIAAEAQAALANLRGGTGTQRGVLADRVERLLHRLKGSALIVGLTPIAAVASRGQALCEALDRVDPEALGNVIAQLQELLSPPVAAPAAPSAPAPAPGPVTVKVHLPSSAEWDAFIEESAQLFDDLDKTLGTVERSARPSIELANLFRGYHTLKGAANAVGLAPIGQHLHLIETFLERIVAAPRVHDLRAVVRALADQNQAIRRNIRRAATEGEVAVDHGRVHATLSGVERPRSEDATGTSWIAANDSVWDRPEVERAPQRSSRHGSAHGSAIESSAAEGSVGASQVDDHDTEAPISDRRFVRVAADRLDSLLDLTGELVVCRSRVLSRVHRLQQLHKEELARHGTVIELIDGFASSTQFTNLDGRRWGAAPVAAGARIGGNGVGGEVSAFGILELDRYEEIHVLSRRLDEAASDLKEVRQDMGSEMQQLTEDAEMLSTITAGLQSQITRARMLTVDVLFSRLQLPLRDAAQRTEREIEIEVIGEQLAIDKAMSDALFGPLLHMVRNAVVHGIEPPAARAQLGKPRSGKIRLAASQLHGEIVLEIADDGRGIDLARLREVGVQRGLLPASIAESDPQVLDMIFARGVTTLEDAGDVAGRGMGGNIVKRAVDRLNGTIQVSTRSGAGTVFRIMLPLSMSITQAVLVRVGGLLLAIPIAYAEMIRASETLEFVDSFGRLRARIGDQMVAVHQTRRIFSQSMLRSEPTDRVVVVCVVGGERIALQVDEVAGREEIVVKSLGALLEGHPLFSGSTARGDGELVLILDIPGILEAELGSERRVRAVAAVPAAADPVPEGVPDTSAASVPVFPLHDELPGAPEPAGIQLAEVTPIAEGRWRVLFVDDSLSVRKVAERMLRSLDVEVITAVDGQDALEKLRAMAFSLVFTDLEMPRMHGYELIREMQLLPAYQAIPVVVISSRSGQKHIDQAIAMGAREYLTKPFSSEILGAVLERLARKGP
jgi:chemosensory pili system protein ChpA (sensor histidine kinase/response regulator)